MGARIGMLVVETIAKIRRAYFVHGMPIKAICRDLRLSRKVVRKVLRSEATEFHYERSTQPMPKVSPWRDELDRLLEANEGKAGRDRLTLIRIFEALREITEKQARSIKYQITIAKRLFRAFRHTQEPRTKPARVECARSMPCGRIICDYRQSGMGRRHRGWNRCRRAARSPDRFERAFFSPGKGTSGTPDGLCGNPRGHAGHESPRTVWFHHADKLRASSGAAPPSRSDLNP
jgi:hypothetical protein